MTYTHLTTKDLIAQTIGIIREFEGKLHATELQIAMNRRLMAHYKVDGKARGSHENARQAVAKDTLTVSEMTIGLPALLAHLAELQTLDAEEDAARETPDVADPSLPESDLDQAPIDTTLESEPTPIKAKGRKLVDPPAEYDATSVRELAHV